MNYFLDVFRKFGDFKGRSRRAEYWYFTLFSFLASAVTFGIDMATGYPFLNGIYSLIAFVPGLAVLARRLHDGGRSAWWFFIVFIPLVGFIVLLVFLCQDSVPGENKWGPNPKEIGNNDIANHLVE